MRTNSDPEDLLREGPWLRRLARALVGGEASAEDLSQAVFASALAVERPRGRLRPWLRAIARNEARRGWRRDALRQTAERDSARSESDGVDVAARLAAQETVARALGRVDEPYRTAVVLRYFDDLPPAEIAERLGLSPAAARKRVSRGVAQLRASLVREHGTDARLWSAVLLPLARPERAAATAVGPAALSSLSLLMSTKWFVAAVVAAVLVALTFLAQPWRGAPLDDAASVLEEVPDADREPTAEAIALAETSPIPDREHVVEAAAAPSAPTFVAPRVRVVDADGDPVDRTRAAWIASDGRVTELELDADGTAARPVGGARGLIARAPGYPVCWLDLSEGGEAELTLEVGEPVRGIVFEDGGIPAEPVQVSAFLWDPAQLPKRVTAELAALGFGFESVRTRTNAAGLFSIEPMPRDWRGRPETASTHAFVDDGRAERLADGTWRLELTRRPTVRGRLVFADTGEPVGGEFTAVLESKHGTKLTSVFADAEGRFAVGMREIDGRMSEERLGLSVGEIEGARAIEGKALFLVVVAGASFPLDLGDLRVDREAVARFLVTRPDGQPVAGAVVQGPRATTYADAAGLASLSTQPGDAVEVLAAGFAPALATVDSRAIRSEQPIVLSPGAVLEVVPLTSRLQPIELTWDRTPFARPIGATGPPGGPFSEIHYAFHEGSVDSKVRGGGPDFPGSAQFRVPSFGPLVVPGLASDASLRVRGLDDIGQVVVEVAVTFNADGATLRRVDLRSASGAHVVRRPSGTLVVRVLADEGALANGGRARIRSRGEDPGWWRLPPDGVLEIGCLRHGAYDIEVRLEGGESRILEGVVFGKSRDVVDVAL